MKTFCSKLAFLFFVLALSAQFGCSADMTNGDGSEAFNEDDSGFSDPIRAAEAALIRHDIAAARQIYAEHLQGSPGDGSLAAGLAVTDLLLFFEMPEVTDLLIQNLGASRGLDADKLIYAEEGFLYWASRGTRWHDDGQYLGIESLLRDELPWDSERLASLAGFVDPLDETGDKLVRQLVVLANALKGVDLHLEAAIEDPEFVRFFLPGEVFHDPELTLVLGRSELSLLRSVIALVRSSIYFLAAYENSWSFQDAFGSWRMDVELVDPRFVSGYQPQDYSMAYLDERLFRRVATAERLAASRASLRQALSTARDSVRFGQQELSSTTMQWEELKEGEALKIDQFLAALISSLDQPTEIPDTQPRTTLDLTPFFEAGRELNPETPWFVQEERINSDDTNGREEDTGWRWTLNEEARRSFWLEGVVHPIPTDNVLKALAPGDQGLSVYFGVLLGAYGEKVEDVFFTTR